MTRKLFVLAALTLLACFVPVQPTAAQEASNDDAKIRAAIKAQTEAWNRGDVEGFMKSYEDSTETTFIGKTVNKGYKPILERYKQGYATREQMGTLTFSDIDVRLLPNGCGRTEIALVTGKFHLERTTQNNDTKDNGIFSLVWRKGKDGWKIILDHTS
ncbi:YybH family protein [Occallatibacter riparius]|uniref:Nuclear transport factor 2 family protein n=1 Tax=Occallatibacter riparius TaxID=1002689 RepID=A0A9J7BTJ9_9BACT|nr:nuclear transport factor 2 family protein [Occallatibacter riparius]UWZ85959.1 nuclear transport factor 2 family protein [Occallatibacter riparius]